LSNPSANGKDFQSSKESKKLDQKCELKWPSNNSYSLPA
jgi:hypothetical protein